MFSDPKALAQSALELLQMSYGEGLSPSALASIELGAATLCNHVWDWHLLTFGEADRVSRAKSYREAQFPVPSRDALSSKFRDEFATKYPEWDLLRQISNGLKHAKPLIADPTQTVQRRVRWEDANWWSTTHRLPTLFIEIDGREHAVCSLVRKFARAYLATPSAVDQTPNQPMPGAG